MDLKDICDALKVIGVQEVILEVSNETATVEFNGFADGGHFRIHATNSDFAENDL